MLLSDDLEDEESELVEIFFENNVSDECISLLDIFDVSISTQQVDALGRSVVSL